MKIQTSSLIKNEGRSQTLANNHVRLTKIRSFQIRKEKIGLQFKKHPQHSELLKDVQENHVYTSKIAHSRMIFDLSEHYEFYLLSSDLSEGRKGHVICHLTVFECSNCRNKNCSKNFINQEKYQVDPPCNHDVIKIHFNYEFSNKLTNEGINSQIFTIEVQVPNIRAVSKIPIGYL